MYNHRKYSYIQSQYIQLYKSQYIQLYTVTLYSIIYSLQIYSLRADGTQMVNRQQAAERWRTYDRLQTDGK